MKRSRKIYVRNETEHLPIRIHNNHRWRSYRPCFKFFRPAEMYSSEIRAYEGAGNRKARDEASRVLGEVCVNFSAL